MSYAATFDAAESVSNYDDVYQYDPLGNVTSLANRHADVLGRQQVHGRRRLDLGCGRLLRHGAEHRLRGVGRDVAGQPLPGDLGTLPQMGFHTVSLPTPPALTAGSDFVVALKLNTPGYDYPLALEYSGAGYSSAATASPGQSYYSVDGTTWTDLTTVRTTPTCASRRTRWPPPQWRQRSLPPTAASAGRWAAPTTSPGRSATAGR